jgi:hypothetical protein
MVFDEIYTIFVHALFKMKLTNSNPTKKRKEKKTFFNIKVWISMKDGGKKGLKREF